MPLKYPDIMQHNNADYAIADAEFIRGGGRVVTDLTALYALSTKADQLKVRVTRVWVTSEAKYYVLVDNTKINQAAGWTIETTGGGETHTHDNKAALDLINKDVNNAPTWNGGAWPGSGGTGTPGISVTNATINGSGHLILTLSDNSTIDAGVAVGPQGATGAAGATGNGIASTSYNVSTGVLTITYTSGATYNTGDLRGAQGIQGIAGTAGSKWYNGAGAPSAGTGVSGDYYLNTTNGDVYTKTASWTLLTNIKGATGATGATGKGISSTSYNSGTGVLTITFSDSSTYSTGDLRGATGATGATGKGISSTVYNSSTGILTITFTDSSTYATSDLRVGSIADNSVTNAKLATVATATIKGRKTAGTGNVEDLTPAEALELIGAKPATYNGEYAEVIHELPQNITTNQTITLAKNSINVITDFGGSFTLGTAAARQITLALPADTAGFEQYIVYMKIGATNTVTVVQPSPDIYMTGSLIFQTNTTYKLIYDRFKTGTSTTAVALSFSKVS